jgi:hypothetical protein
VEIVKCESTITPLHCQLNPVMPRVFHTFRITRSTEDLELRIWEAESDERTTATRPQVFATWKSSLGHSEKRHATFEVKGFARFTCQHKYPSASTTRGGISASIVTPVVAHDPFHALNRPAPIPSVVLYVINRYLISRRDKQCLKRSEMAATT